MKRLETVETEFPVQEYRGCPLTGSTNEEELLVINDFQMFTDQGGDNRMIHRVVRNLDSGLIYANPVLTEFGFVHLFEKAGASYTHPCRVEHAQVRAFLFNEWFPEAGLLTDLGCGHGLFLANVSPSVGRYGVDVDTPTIEGARAKNPGIGFHLDKLEGFVEGHEFQEDEVVTMFHVLEHMPDPLGFLKKIWSASAVGTKLMVEVPVIDFIPGSYLEQDLVGFFTPQHLTHFSLGSLMAIMFSAGWSVTQVKPWEENISVIVSSVKTVPMPTGLTPDQISGDWEKVMAYKDAQLESVDRMALILLSELGIEDPIIIWGAGQHTEELFHTFEKYLEDRLMVIVDNDPLKQGCTMHGVPIVSPDWLDWDMRVFAPKVVISSFHAQSAIEKDLLSRGFAPELIVKLYPDGPF